MTNQQHNKAHTQHSSALADMAYDFAKNRIADQRSVRTVKRLISAQQEAIEQITQSMTLLQSKVAEMLNESKNEQAAQLNSLNGNLDRAISRVDQLSESAEKTVEDIEKTQDQIETLSANLSPLQKLPGELAALKTAVSRLESEAKQRTRFQSNEPDFQSFTRYLPPAEIDQFVDLAAEVFDLDLSHRTVAYLAHHMREVERSSIGRIATSIQAMLIRGLALMSLREERLDYLEIGVLFGVNACIAWDLLRHHFNSSHITCIDPLDGYYDAQTRDALTGLPINKRTLMQNLQKVDCTEDQATVIQGLSEDPRVIAQAESKTYNFLLIDGDHGYDGVRRDFENYAPMVRSGGIVVIDDYGVKEWPDVTEFCDKVAMQSPDYDVLNATHRTLVLRKH